MGELVTKIDTQERALGRMELALANMLSGQNNEKLDTCRHLSALTTDITKISILLNEVNQRNLCMDGKQDTMMTELSSIKSNIIIMKNESDKAKDSIGKLESTMDTRYVATTTWRDELSGRLTKLERLTYWIYIVGSVVFAGAVTANYLLDMYLKFKK